MDYLNPYTLTVIFYPDPEPLRSLLSQRLSYNASSQQWTVPSWCIPRYRTQISLVSLALKEQGAGPEGAGRGLRERAEWRHCVARRRAGGSGRNSWPLADSAYRPRVENASTAAPSSEAGWTRVTADSGSRVWADGQRGPGPWPPGPWLRPAPGAQAPPLPPGNPGTWVFCLLGRVFIWPFLHLRIGSPAKRFCFPRLLL